MDKCLILQGLSESTRLGARPRQSTPLSFSLPCLSPHLPPVVMGSLMLGKSLESHPAPVELCNLSKYLEFSVPQSLLWKMITEFLCRTVMRVGKVTEGSAWPRTPWLMGGSQSIS